MSSPTVACAGIATLDLIHRVAAIPTEPVKIRADSFVTALGGMAAAAACAVATLGGAAQFWGPTGDDAFGETLRRALERAGVDISPVPALAGASSAHSAVLIDRAGERLIVNHRGSALAAGPEVLPLHRLQADAVLADVRWPAGALAMLDRANALGIPTVLDAEMGDEEALHLLVPKARHAIFSERGFVQWAGVASDTADGAARLASLCGAGADLAAVTLGARGVIYATPSGPGHQPAFPVVTVETLGAGDVFHGAYALALAAHQPVRTSLRFAAAAAAVRCTRAGGHAALPRRPEVEALLHAGTATGAS